MPTRLSVRSRLHTPVGLVLLLGVLMWPCISQCQQQIDHLQNVDLRIGTAGDGQTYPAVGVPFGMTSWTPETQPTEDKCLAPYYYNAAAITGFRASHWLSGSCTQDYGSVTLMPVSGKLRVMPLARASRFTHKNEQMTPSFYAVDLPDELIHVEMTGSSHAGMIRVTYPAGREHHLIIDLNVRHGQGFVEIRPEQREIVGFNPVVRMYQGAGQSAGFSGYFVARFDADPKSMSTWCDGKTLSARILKNSSCSRIGAAVSFAGQSKATVAVKIGMSFTSLEEAEKNLQAEVGQHDFGSIQAASEAAWRSYLNHIDVDGGTPDERRIFYTALYHTALAPRAVSDVDGTYNGFAQEGHQHQAPPGQAYYDDFSLWDTFRTLHPLLTILEPTRDQQMVQSLVDKGEQGGFLPIFPTWNHYTSEMIGDHAGAVIADAYFKELRNFDVESAWRHMRKNAFVIPPHSEYVNGHGRRALESYMHYGFIPLEDEVLDAYHPREQISRTLEYAYDDYVAASLAKALGHLADAKILLRRSENWRNVLDPESGYVRGRHQDGSWVNPFDPSKPARYITEGIPWQYTFFVPQDIPGLIAAMGGKDAFVQKLDGLFARGLYDHGNEPSHAIAYLYLQAGAPAKTQERVRQILNTQYRPGPSGLPGNDDAGQMSAWYVMSAMGFYPYCPGVPKYVIGSPLFRKIVIHQENGRDFTVDVRNYSSGNLYVRRATMNGNTLHGLEFRHSDIVNGSRLTLEMSSIPE